MQRIVLDPGHGGEDPGAVSGQYREKHFNLQVAGAAARYINERYSAAVHLTRITDITAGLGERAAYANELRANLFVSLHTNAGGGTGFESYVYTSAASGTQVYRDRLHDYVARFYALHGIRDRGKKKANFLVLRETNMSAVLLENLFIDNNNDLALLNRPDFIQQLSEYISEGIAQTLGLDKRIEGTGIVPARAVTTTEPDQARQFLKAKNPAAPDYIDIYVKMGGIYRIRWDAVFAQSCKETGFWKFGGLVRPEQYNFAGLGSFDGNEGASFKTPEDGIEAQFQHWHVYFHGGKLPTGRPELDARRNAALSTGWGGKLNYVEELGGKWAPAPDYGISIVRDYMAPFVDGISAVLQPGPVPEPQPEPDPGDNGGGWNPAAEIARLQKDGFVVNDHAPDSFVTWGEFATVLNRLRDQS